MKEMMLDLETLDVKSSALVLSVGAVIFETIEGRRCIGAGRPRLLDYKVLNRFYRVLNIQEQLEMGRTISQGTLLWWMQQDVDARDEAFAPVRREVKRVMFELQEFVDSHDVVTRSWAEPNVVWEDRVKINKFWASPVSFDFGIWNSLADDFNHSTPWTYRQVYDVRTVLNEASYSAKSHKLTRSIEGKPHMPVYDCEWQIDELIAARNKIGRRMK